MPTPIIVHLKRAWADLDSASVPQAVMSALALARGAGPDDRAKAHAHLADHLEAVWVPDNLFADATELTGVTEEVRGRVEVLDIHDRGPEHWPAVSVTARFELPAMFTPAEAKAWEAANDEHLDNAVAVQWDFVDELLEELGDEGWWPLLTEHCGLTLVVGQP